MTACPACGEPAERGQLVCTSCGSRLALHESRPLPAVPVLVVLLVLVVLGAGAFGFALSELTSDDDGSDVTVAAEPPAAPAPPADEGATGPPTETTTPEATGAPQQPTRSLLLEWPDGLTAHTVVLVTTSDRQAAGRLARQAARSGIEAGMLRSDDYNLGTGLWIVFAGRFDTPEGAARQARDLADRFPGAYPQLVEPVD